MRGKKSDSPHAHQSRLQSSKESSDYRWGLVQDGCHIFVAPKCCVQVHCHIALKKHDTRNKLRHQKGFGSTVIDHHFLLKKYVGKRSMMLALMTHFPMLRRKSFGQFNLSIWLFRAKMLILLISTLFIPT